MLKKGLPPEMKRASPINNRQETKYPLVNPSKAPKNLSNQPRSDSFITFFSKKPSNRTAAKEAIKSRVYAIATSARPFSDLMIEALDDWVDTIGMLMCILVHEEKR